MCNHTEKAKKWLPWQRLWLQGIRNICVLLAEHSNPIHITNSPVAIVLTKPVIAILVPKLVAMATCISASGPAPTTWFLGPIGVHNPKGISIGSTVIAQMTVEYPYTFNGTPVPPSKKMPLPMGDMDPHL